MSHPHLDSRVAALADGQLAGADRDQALVHVAICAACRTEVEQHRALKARVSRLAAPELPADLSLRLLALSPAGTAAAGAAGAADADADAGAGPTGAGWDGLLAGPAGRGALGGLPARSLVAGCLALAALGAGGAALAHSGGQGVPAGGTGRVVDPASFSVTLHGRTTRDAVLQDPAFAVVVAVGDR